MSATAGERIKVVLRWVQILDTLDPFYKERGEFRFKARVSSDMTPVQETQIPKEGYFEISDHPAWNKVTFDKVVFTGEVGERLEIELIGEELDNFTPNDMLDIYKRVYTGPPESYIGEHTPHDEEDDPENMSNWRVCYRIERG